MMAAMMLPGAVPAILRRAGRPPRRAAPLFAGSYLAVWAAVGLAVYALYRPHGSTAAGVLMIAAGVYELTPLKRTCRRRCREEHPLWIRVRALLRRFEHRADGDAGGAGVMSLDVDGRVAGLVLVQKLLPPRAAVDVPLALAIIGLGILIAVAPSSVPGLAPTM